VRIHESIVVSEMLRVVAEWSDEQMLDDPCAFGGWLRLDPESGRMLFNNEYELSADDAPEMAVALLGYYSRACRQAREQAAPTSADRDLSPGDPSPR
jgi:hypothetical protein